MLMMGTILKPLRWKFLKQIALSTKSSSSVPLRHYRISSCFLAKNNKDHRELVLQSNAFKSVPVKNKNVFNEMIKAFEKNNANKRGVIEFILAALRHIDDFGVSRDLETYKKLMDLFPKGKLIPKNIIQQEFYHYPMHQECALDILEMMGINRVCPDDEIYDMIINIFGRWGPVYRRMARMMFWMPKFKNAHPYHLVKVFPNDALELAKIALKQMTLVDLQSKVSIFQAEELKDSIDHTWIASVQSPLQKELIANLPSSSHINVEGPFTIWLKRYSLSYFVLQTKTPPISPQLTKEMNDDITNISLSMFGGEKTKADLIKPPTVHEQREGTILSMCATGTSSRDSLLSWIRFLQESNPRLLDDIPVLFTLKSPPTELTKTDEMKPLNDLLIDADETKYDELPHTGVHSSSKFSSS